jgi:hypothetical protein
MEELFVLSYTIADLIHGLCKSNIEQVVSLTITNEAGDEVYTQSSIRHDIITCEIQFFSDGLMISESDFISYNYEDLADSIIKTLDVQNKTGMNDEKSDSSIMSYSKFFEQLASR